MEHLPSIVKRFFPLSVCLALLACTTPTHTPPVSGPTAVILFKKYPDLQMNAFTYEQAADCSGRQMVLSTRDDYDKKVVVPAERPLSISFGYQLGVTFTYNGFVVSGCSPMGTFVPKADESYTAYGTIDRNGCILHIERADSGQPVKYETRQRRGAPLNDASSFCH